MTGHYYHIEGIGKILFERSERARRINISVRPFKGVRVAVPRGASFTTAKRFVESKKEWIARNLVEIEKIESRQRDVAQKVLDIDKSEARKILVKRLDELAKMHEFVYNRVTIRNQKTRWGSCSQKNNISLNIQLVRLPQRLIDFILLHELVHTRYKNHGRRFYAELDRLFPDRRALDRELKSYDVCRL